MTDYKSMFEQAVRTLAAIDEALGIGDDGCAAPDMTLTAIEELKAAAHDGQQARHDLMVRETVKDEEIAQLRELCDDLSSSVIAAASLAPHGSGAKALLDETIDRMAARARARQKISGGGTATAPSASGQAHYPEEWGPSDNRRLTCVCGDPDPFHAMKTPNANVTGLAPGKD